jgi:hypothetical protein
VAKPEVNQPPEPRRVKEFAEFFKRYMSISSVVAAALPIPVTAAGLIPTFAVQTSYLSTYTSMFCFLCLGFVFYTRHQLASRMFPQFLTSNYAAGVSPSSERKRTLAAEFIDFGFKVLRNFAWIIGKIFVPILPFLLILSSLYFALHYHEALGQAIRQLRGSGGISATQALKDTSLDAIPNSMALEMYYMGIFITAESAFILMAMKEYIQDLVGLADFTILTGVQLPAGKRPEDVLLSRFEERGFEGASDAGQMPEVLPLTSSVRVDPPK